MSAAILSVLPKRKGRQREPDDGRRVLRLFPSGYGGRSFIYAIAFKGDVVKVGQTTSPRQRLLQHWKTGNGEVEWIHVFSSMHTETARSVERMAPAALAGIAQQINGSEWFFVSASKAEVLAAIRPLIDKAKALLRERWARRDMERAQVARVAELLKEHGLLDVVNRI